MNEGDGRRTRRLWPYASRNARSVLLSASLIGLLASTSSPAQSQGLARAEAPDRAAARAVKAGVAHRQTGSKACAQSDGGLGVARVIRIDGTGGPLYGNISKQSREPNLLKPKEIVLTFDDGPVPWTTTPVLKALADACTKATFFSVGRMAAAYPDMVRKILSEGHTVGTHTWSHQILTRIGQTAAMREIELGIAAVAMAAGQPIAPFFRFPGLNDSRALLANLGARGIATFTVDVVTDDSFTDNPAELLHRTLQRIDQHRGGIVLFHDIKPATAKALPSILAALKQRGYRVVHLEAATTTAPLSSYDDRLKPMLAKALAARGQSGLLPVVPATGPLPSMQGDDVPLTRVNSAISALRASRRNDESEHTGTIGGATDATTTDDHTIGIRPSVLPLSAWGRAFRHTPDSSADKAPDTAAAAALPSLPAAMPPPADEPSAEVAAQPTEVAAPATGPATPAAVSAPPTDDGTLRESQ